MLLCSCHHQHSVVGNYVLYYYDTIQWPFEKTFCLELKADSTFHSYYRFQPALCAGDMGIPHPTYYKYTIRNDSIILMTGASEPYYFYDGVGFDTIGWKNVSGIEVPVSKVIIDSTFVPSQLFPDRVFYLHNGNIYQQKKGKHYINRFKHDKTTQPVPASSLSR